MSEKTAIKEKIDVKIDRPKLYKVMMHNDDYTTMEFVVDILMKVFSKNASEATKIMLDVHKKGMGVAGVYPYDIAVTKVSRAHSEARENGFPLKLSLKEE
jgi:ATP-dependent Clp protease adaptor protein ClpS